jgi:hypothetical protein
VAAAAATVAATAAAAVAAGSSSGCAQTASRAKCDETMRAWARAGPRPCDGMAATRAKGATRSSQAQKKKPHTPTALHLEVSLEGV